MHRRTLLARGGLAALALAAGGCSTRTTRPAAAPIPARRRPMTWLAPVNVSWERVIRTTVGLRPHRPSGFVLRAERFGEKLLVHNYGHGGAGWSLSWGTATLAADMAMNHPARRAAVIGAGIVGITAARVLQRRGFDVTIYSKALPPETTSNMALAGFTPTSGLVEFSQRTPEWVTQFQQAVDISYRQWQLLAGSRYGVTWIHNYNPTDDPAMARGTNLLMPEHIVEEREVLGPGEHPFPSPYAIRRNEMRFEPSIALDALLGDVALFGGRVVVRSFDRPEDLAALPEPIVVNCTGLGAKALFGDEQLVPLKGQLVALIPQPEVGYATTGGINLERGTPGVFVHMMPRSDGIILGGTSQRDVWSLEPDDGERKRVIEKHIELFTAMRRPGNQTA
ncbi:MAG: FAD-dependent oxidoreductase [Acidobacteriota bacterium]